MHTKCSATVLDTVQGAFGNAFKTALMPRAKEMHEKEERVDFFFMAAAGASSRGGTLRWLHPPIRRALAGLNRLPDTKESQSGIHDRGRGG